jgi:transcriptional regulator with GAF, ATPase, and Fis domain
VASAGNEATSSLELDIWREIGRELEIERAVERLAAPLAQHLPADVLLLRRIDRDRGALETAAIAKLRKGPGLTAARRELSPDALRAVLAWCSAGETWCGSAADSPARHLLDDEADAHTGAVIAGPIRFGEGPGGVVILWSHRAKAFSAAHVRTVHSLLAAFGVALENDRRWHETARLRERLEADNRALLSRLQRQDIAESVVGAEAGLRDVMSRVEKVAATTAPVLILGETGSGKEVIARAIHGRSSRKDGPIVRVNCGAIPPELVDSELFGHERGSFTGAVGTRRGWFERADGGTLFLDEVGELPSAAQVRLLRVLQEGTFERVGGQKPLSVDVRIVAATNANLQDRVARGSFRQDLWYRISVFPIRLPPLRERPGDIPQLAAHFAGRAGTRLGGLALVPTAGDIEALVAYAWPGNVRELAAVIERAAILGDGRRLEVAAALGSAHGERDGSDGARAGSLRASGHEPITTLDRAMAEHIERALGVARGRIEGPHGAAALLGINPHTLRARMRKLGVEWTRFRAP